MPKIEGWGGVSTRLRARAKQRTAGAEAGYGAPYAIYVHENLESYHEVGQAKFLETPLRLNGAKYRKIMRDALKRGLGVRAASLEAATVLLEDSLPLVPVDTGYLKSTAFVRNTR